MFVLLSFQQTLKDFTKTRQDTKSINIKGIDKIHFLIKYLTCASTFSGMQ